LPKSRTLLAPKKSQVSSPKKVESHFAKKGRKLLRPPKSCKSLAPKKIALDLSFVGRPSRECSAERLQFHSLKENEEKWFISKSALGRVHACVHVRFFVTPSQKFCRQKLHMTQVLHCRTDWPNPGRHQRPVL
jgi:hypothetical protein